MRHVLFIICCIVLSLLLGTLAKAEDPIRASACQLRADPPSFNQKLVEVDGFVSHGFEDFTLFDPSCPDWPAVWLEFGGTVNSDTVYCCGSTAGTTRPKQLIVEGIQIPLIDDESFKQFNREIQPPFRSGRFGSIAHATLVGRFFAGRKETYPNGTTAWAGYGRMGCCSPLVIQEVKSVYPQDRDDLDYGESADAPDIDRVGCGYQEMTPIWPWQDEIKAQQQSDKSPNTRAFDDPGRVASDFLTTQLKLDTSQPLQLTEKRKTAGRVVYVWRPSGKTSSYMVVVSKPFMLSFYAHDPRRVAWVVIAAYSSSCDKTKSVTRIR